MTLHPPVPLSGQHRLESFDCGKPVLNDWLRRHAYAASAGGSAKTFVVTTSDAEVVGYYSLTVGQVEPTEAPARLGKGMGRYPIPVVLLARLAVSLGYQGRGIGRGLLQDAITRTLTIADHAGIRALMTHPLDDAAASFYLRFGFIPSPLRERQLLLLLKDARRLMNF
ncbi:MAG: GNAT family N-acetyltransferase [Desulfobacteraceae bacterium]|nr:GNAT family N-acetyltransferase [Desulfobacteraceae bacterium]